MKEEKQMVIMLKKTKSRKVGNWSGLFKRFNKKKDSLFFIEK
jgi:hypothetical protein